MKLISAEKKLEKYEGKLLLDCSNGVGGIEIKQLLINLKEYLDVEVINNDNP